MRNYMIFLAPGDTEGTVFRLQPEAWLQSTLAGDLTPLDDRLGHHPIYQQVPAFAASDRASYLSGIVITVDGGHNARGGAFTR